MVFANRTYLDSLNRYIVLWSYKALTGLSEKRLVSTKPKGVKVLNVHSKPSTVATIGFSIGSRRPPLFMDFNKNVLIENQASHHPAKHLRNKLLKPGRQSAILTSSHSGRNLHS